MNSAMGVLSLFLLSDLLAPSRMKPDGDAPKRQRDDDSSP